VKNQIPRAFLRKKKGFEASQRKLLHTVRPACGGVDRVLWAGLWCTSCVASAGTHHRMQESGNGHVNGSHAFACYQNKPDGSLQPGAGRQAAGVRRRHDCSRKRTGRQILVELHLTCMHAAPALAVNSRRRRRRSGRPGWRPRHGEPLVLLHG
jgi:hypothetical protein